MFLAGALVSPDPSPGPRSRRRSDRPAPDHPHHPERDRAALRDHRPAHRQAHRFRRRRTRARRTREARSHRARRPSPSRSIRPRWPISWPSPTPARSCRRNRPGSSRSSPTAWSATSSTEHGAAQNAAGSPCRDGAAPPPRLGRRGRRTLRGPQPRPPRHGVLPEAAFACRIRRARRPRAEAIAERGFGLYAVEEKASGDFIGFVGLAPVAFTAAFTPATEVGWRLTRASWGNGYATEAARGVIAHAFGPLGFASLVAFTAAWNTRSRRVMEKIGMTRDPMATSCIRRCRRNTSSPRTSSTASARIACPQPS